MYRDEHAVPVAEHQLDHLLRLAVHGRGNQSAETRYTVVAVYHIVAYLQLVDLLEGDDSLAAAGVLARECHAVETLEDLVVGIAAYLQPFVHKTRMQRPVHCRKAYRITRNIFKDSRQTVGLLLLVGKDIEFVAFRRLATQIIGQQVEILVENRLRQGVKCKARVVAEVTLFVHLYRVRLCQTLLQHFREVALFEFRTAHLPAEFVKQQREIVACPYRILAYIVRNRIVFSLFFP